MEIKDLRNPIARDQLSGTTNPVLAAALACLDKPLAWPADIIVGGQTRQASRGTIVYRDGYVLHVASGDMLTGTC